MSDYFDHLLLLIIVTFNKRVIDWFRWNREKTTAVAVNEPKNKAKRRKIHEFGAQTSSESDVNEKFATLN